MKVLALFPGCSCLQFLIACSMQKRRGKAWEKESYAWCQVDMRPLRRTVPSHYNSQTLRWSASKLPNNKLYWRCLSNVTVSSFLTRYYKKDLKILCQTPIPLMASIPSCLPDIMHATLSLRPSPSVFPYCKRSKLEAGMAWERGYESSSLQLWSDMISQLYSLHCHSWTYSIMLYVHLLKSRAKTLTRSTQDLFCWQGINPTHQTNKQKNKNKHRCHICC